MHAKTIVQIFYQVFRNKTFMTFVKRLVSLINLAFNLSFLMSGHLHSEYEG